MAGPEAEERRAPAGSTAATPSGAAPGASSAGAQDETGPRKLYRNPSGRVLGGVASGLAAHLGMPVLWIRAAFVVLAIGQGLGVLLYAAFWFFVPMGVERGGPLKTGSGPGATAVPGGRRRPMRDRRELAALIALVAGVAVGLNSFGGSTATYLWPLAVVCVGCALVWRQADDAQRARLASIGGRRRWQVVRGVAGVLLVAAGIAAFLMMQGSLGHTGMLLQAVLAVLVGVVLLAGPFLARLVEDLGAERRERIRAQERAEVAAHVHDSVLHTLTLIMRHADNPKEVTRLARSQERELREWLYRPDPKRGADRSGGEAGDGTPEPPKMLAESMRRTAGEVEDAHGVPVEVVCVGDCPMDAGLVAQLQAAREAMVNAAKYGGEGGPVSVFAEVEGRTVFIFVRDRGPGFDPDRVPEDRLGVKESIVGRMARNGGKATVRSTPGEGTEIELEMERERTTES
ncbi:histidine kinase [Mangrovactinospora gilvigrisea]|uniref:Histidine kinase n=1 Tax=Mangrovactinospora gilvigrisea TaxID=1428644 RepID=A0A1J7BRI3_9ACTN|nr:ATP-binding protein [Mangrovactinospora gilvigrisea]OIV36049.1 histidine kinase [Mangrovactinospora gilvigrisea]